MTIDIHDYAGRAKSITFDIENLDLAMMENIRGDDVLTLVYLDGTIQQFDSSDCRLASFNDGFELMFHRASGLNKFERMNQEGGAK